MKWILQLTVRDRSGIVNRMTSTFAERGINIDRLLATADHNLPTVILQFEAPEEVKDHLVRILRRFPEVTDIEVFDETTPGVRTFVLISVDPDADRECLAEFYIFSETDEQILAHTVGTPAEVDRRLSDVEKAGALKKALGISVGL